MLQAVKALKLLILLKSLISMEEIGRENNSSLQG